MRHPGAGSVILQRWNEQRRLERALGDRSRRMAREFAGAGITRLTMSLTQSSRAINADLDGSLAILRARARDLCANYDYARRFLSLVANNIVGPCGPTLQVRALMSDGKTLDQVANDAIETHFARWGMQCDIRGQLTFAQMLQVAVKGVARDGEGLIRFVRGKDLPYGLALQLLEADRLDESLNQKLPGGNIIRQGVELDSALRPIAYWIFKQHPGENYNTLLGLEKWERVPAGDLLHLYINERPEQVRGYTWMHAVLLRAAHSRGFEEAAVVAARLGASKAGFFKRTGDPTSQDAIKQMADAVDAQGRLQMDVEPGEFAELPPGYDLADWSPEYPHQMYADFVRSCLRGFSAGVDVDYASLSNDRSSENYSSIRHGALEARDVWKTGQEWVHARAALPVFREWLATGLILGQITLPQGKVLPAERLSKFADAARFQGRRWDWVDPKNDAEAARLLIEAGLASRTEIAAGQGRDFADVVNELAQEKKLLEAAGLPSTFDLTSTGGEPTPQPTAAAKT